MLTKNQKGKKGGNMAVPGLYFHFMELFPSCFTLEKDCDLFFLIFGSLLFAFEY